jgi:hypothetical protein
MRAASDIERLDRRPEQAKMRGSFHADERDQQPLRRAAQSGQKNHGECGIHREVLSVH